MRTIIVYETKDPECPVGSKFTARIWFEGQPMPVTFYADGFVEVETKAREWWDAQIEAERRRVEMIDALRERNKKRVAG